MDLNAVRYAGGTTETKTFTFVNKALSDQPTYWPILAGVGDPTINAGEFLPVQSLGGVTVRNDIGSIGVGRKLSDLLERYTPVDQTVSVYVAAVATDATTVASWGTPVITCLCARWSQSGFGADNTVAFEMKGLTAKDPVLTLEVTRNVSGMEAAPDSSLGRTVPLLIGQGVDVIPIRISDDRAVTTHYAWGVCLANHLKNVSTSASLYAKNYYDDWVPLSIGNPGNTGSPASQLGLDGYASQAFRINLNSSTVITGIRLQCKGNGSPGRVSTAILRVFILRVGLGFVPLEEVATTNVNLTYYDAQNNAGTANFSINATFDTPAVLWASGESYYSFGWEVTGFQVNELSINCGSPTVNYRIIKDPTSTAAYDSPNAWRLFSLGGPWPLHVLHEITPTFTDHVATATSGGLSYSKLTITQPSPDTGQASATFKDFPLLIGNANGISDYATGTVVADLPSVAQKLGYVWSPFAGSWSNPNTWDTTTFTTLYQDLYGTGGSPGIRNRQPLAVFDGRVTYTQVLSELCRGTASRVGVFTNGKMFLMPWGNPVAAVADIPSHDVIPEQWAESDVTAVVNRVIVNTRLSYRIGGRSFENQGADGRSEEYGYQYSNDFNANDFIRVDEMTRASRTLFGERSIGEINFPVYPQSKTGQGGYLSSASFLNGEGSVLAEYYLARFARPPVYATFLIPWTKYQNTIRMFDVVTFCHTDFPAFYGTDPDATVPSITGASAAPADVLNGYELVRAQGYRGLVERITYVLPKNHPPQIRLTVLVLLNHPFDPT